MIDPLSFAPISSDQGDNEMIELDREALVNAITSARERKLNSSQKLAVYAFTLEKVPAKILARVFNVRTNAIYYIGHWEHTPAYRAAKDSFDRLGRDRVWAEIVTPAQIELVNADLRNLMYGKPLKNDRHRSGRNYRSGPRTGRTGAIAPLPEAASDGAGGNAEAS
jgi:hypothetical protein